MSRLRRKLDSLERRLKATRLVWRRRSVLHQELVPPRPWRKLPGAGIYHPVDGGSVDRIEVPVTGWAMVDGQPPARVEITVDGAPAAVARTGFRTEDVRIATGVTSARMAGWEARVDFGRLPDTTRAVEIAGVAIGMHGETTPVPPVRVGVAPPRVVAESAEDLPAPAWSARPATPRLRAAGDGGLRLLVCTHNLGYGGAQLLLLEMLRRFAQDAGATGTVIAPQDGATRTDLEALGYEVHVTHGYPQDTPAAYEGKLEELAAWLSGRSFDVALVNSMVAFPGGDLVTRLGLPMVWAVHESYDLRGFWFASNPSDLHPYAERRGEAALRQAAAVIFEADATRALYEPDLPGVRCLTLPYGVDVDALDHWRSRFDWGAGRASLGLDPEDRIVLCVGTFEPRKAQLALIQAFAHVADRAPDVKLALVGAREGEEYTELVRLAVETYGLEDQVHIVPVTPDIRTWYACADLLVSASDIESLPRSALEAMALGLPVLAARVFGLPELIDDGRNGWLCEPRDTASLARGLERALTLDERARQEVTREARLEVERHHDSRRCAQRWLDVLSGAAAFESTAGSAKRSDGVASS